MFTTRIPKGESGPLIGCLANERQAPSGSQFHFSQHSTQMYYVDGQRPQVTTRAVRLFTLLTQNDDYTDFTPVYFLI